MENLNSESKGLEKFASSLADISKIALEGNTLDGKSPELNEKVKESKGKS